MSLPSADYSSGVLSGSGHRQEYRSEQHELRIIGSTPSKPETPGSQCPVRGMRLPGRMDGQRVRHSWLYVLGDRLIR